MNFRKSLPPSGSGGVPFVPMMDVVFLLLCFFVTSQIFAQWETEVGIALPTAQTGEIPKRLPGEIILNIMPTGEVIVNGRALDAEELQAMLRRLTEVYPGQSIILRADKTTEYGLIMRVLDTCRQADVWNISFATIAPER